MHQTLHQLLLQLREAGPTTDFGICCQVKHLCDSKQLYDELRALFSRWPEFSGHPEFPVPHPDQSPSQAFHTEVDLWDRSTEYGAARWRLLDWLIEQTEPETLAHSVPILEENLP